MEVTTLSVQVKSDGIDQATKSLDALGSQAERTEKSVGKLTEKLANTSTSFNAVKSSLAELRSAMAVSFPTDGANALNKAMMELSSTLTSIKGKNIKVDVGAKDLGKDAEVARKGVESLNQSLASGQNVMQMFGKELYHIRNLLGGTMLAGALINTSQAAIKMADAWTLMGAKLKMQLGSAFLAADAQEKLYLMAQKLRVPLEGVTQLFTRLVPAMSEYGYSVKDAMQVTEAMAAALKVSGATAAEASSVMLQFSQSMQAGRLNGAEFNAVAEGAPIILRLIGQEINKTRGELKKMGADGVISVELITEVLKKNRAELAKMSTSVPDTVESAFTNLTNAVTKYIGEANNAVGVTGLIAAAIKLLAENLDTVGTVLKYVAIAGFAAYSASLASAMVQMAIAPALSASLAAELGLVGVAATGAAGGVGLLDTALKFLARNPMIVIFTLLATGAAIVYDKFKQAEESTKSFTNQLAELDKLKGAQAMQGYASAIDDVLEKLSAENTRLTELMEKRKKAYKLTDIIAYSDAIEDQQKKVEELANKYGILAQRQADVNSGEALKKVSAIVKELQDEGKWLDYQISQGKKLHEIDKKIFDTETQIATAKDGFFKTGLENQLKELKNNKAKLDTLDELEKASKKSVKEEESMAKRLEKSYLSALNSAQAFVDGQEEELGLKRKLTESEKEYEKVMRTISDLKTKFRGADVGELENIAKRIKFLGEEKRIRDELNKFLDKEQELKLQAIALEAQYADSQFKSVQGLKEKIKLQQMAFSDIQQTPLGAQQDSMQVDRDRITFLQQQISLTAELIDLQVQKAYWEAYMANDSAGMARAEKAGEELQKRIDGYENEVKVLQALIPLQNQYTDQLALSAKKNMLDIGRSPGQILAEGFGEAGAAIAKMAEAYKSYGDDAAKIDKYVADQRALLDSKGLGTKDNYAKIDKEVADKRIQINAQMYGSLASAAKGFFSENSKGYQAMAKAEKAFRVIELAMAAKTALTKMALMGETLATYLFGVTAATAATEASVPVVVAAEQTKALAAGQAAVPMAAQMPGPLAFVGAAAMIALLAGIGVSLGGSSSTPNLSAQRQESQGAGTVFGDSGAKSESTTKALEMLVDNSEISLSYNAGMLASLKNIESALVGVAKLVVRGGVQGQVGFADGMGTIKSEGITKFAKAGEIALLLPAVFAPLKAIVGALFSVKKSVVDSGLIQNAQSLAEVMDGGLDVTGYTDIETKKKKFGRTKTSTETNLSDVSTELQDQLTKVVLGLGDSITQAAKALKLDGDSFTSTLDSFVVDIGRISIQGMDAKQIQETLTNVFSKLGDEMASAVMPGLIEFQGIGEGYLETLIRVASTVATVDGIFAEVGTTFGTTGMEAVKAKMDLVELAGGIQELSSMVGNFFDKFYTEAEKKAVAVTNITTKMADLGVQGFDPLAENARVVFRSMVENAKETNPKLMVELLKLSDAVDSVAPAFKKAASAAEIAEKALSQQDEYNKLTMSSSEYLAYARGKELEAMDESLRPMQKRIYALQDEAKITEQKTTLEDTYNKLALSGTALLTYNRNLELAKMDESLRPLQMRIYALQDEKTALEDMKKGASGALAILDKSVVAQKKILKDDLDGKILNINSAKDAEDTRFEAEKAKLEATKTISDEYYATQQEAAANAVTSIKEYRDELKTLFDDISGAVDKLTNNNKQLQAISYSAAKAQLDSVIATAKSSGQLPDSKSFKDVLDSLTSLSESDFSTMLDFQREQLVSAGKLSQLGGVAGGKLSAAESAVLAAEANVKATKDAAKEAADRYTEETKSLEDKHKLAIGYYDSSIKALQTQYDLDVEFYDNLLQNAKDQLDIANGTYIATIGVRDAVDYFGTALGMYVAAKDADQARLVDQVNQMGLKTTGYEDALAKQESDKQALVTEMAGLREDLAAQNKAIATNTLATAKVLQRWDGDGQPEVRNVA